MRVRGKQSLFRDSGVHFAAVFSVRLRTVEAGPQSAGKLLSKKS